MSTPYHLEHVALPPGTLTNWIGTASALGAIGLCLSLELRSITEDPSRHNIGRAARAARYVAGLASDEQAVTVNALADQLKELAQ